MPIVQGKRTCFVLRSPDSGINPYLAFAIVIQAGLAGVRGKEILPPPVDKSSRLVKDEEKASYDKLPLSLTEAVECAKKSGFLQNSPCKDIANRFIEVIEQEAM